MKIAFSRERAFTPDFNGNKSLDEADQLSATVKVMTLNDILDLGDAFKQAGFEKGDMKEMSLAQMQVLVRSAGKYVPKYVSLKGNDGFTLEDVVTYPQFLSLATELLFTLLNFSAPTEADVKNS